MVALVRSFIRLHLLMLFAMSAGRFDAPSDTYRQLRLQNMNQCHCHNFSKNLMRVNDVKYSETWASEAPLSGNPVFVHSPDLKNHFK